jgi:hypothetical protein
MTNINSPTRVFLTIAALAVLVSSTALGEQLSSAERAVTIQYKGGDVEHYVIAWSAESDLAKREEGSPSTLFHPIDDRRCFWSTSGAVTRQVFLVSRTGEHFASPSLSRVYTKAQANEGSSFMLAGFRSENCNDAASRRNSDYENMKRLVLSDFTATVDADYRRVKSEIALNAGVIKVDDANEKKVAEARN